MNETHKTDLSILEKAVITYLYYHNIKSWNDAYLELYPDNRISSKESLTTAVSKFRRSEKVQTYLETLKAIDKVRRPTLQTGKTEKEEERKGKEKGVFTDGKRNFTEISDFLDYCNEQANNTTNERDRQQYLKFISDLLSFKNSGNDTKTDIQRFYSPIQCSACPLYNAHTHEK